MTSPLRDAITRATRIPEPQALPPLVDKARVARDTAAAIHDTAQRLTRALRERKQAGGREGLVQGLLQEFALSSQEGVALMCLAEALLRIPDNATRDALIRDKIARGQWQAHVGKSPSLFVNAAAWGLLLTGKLVSTHSESGLASALGRLITKGGEPLIRNGVDLAMRMMGEQFVTGETIGEALAHARPLEAKGFRYSYDMLGEAALTGADAARYRAAYAAAIDAIGHAAAGRGIYTGPGISIKLSALHPRYARAQRDRVHDELYPVLKALSVQAKSHDIGLNIDAEEADRLELSLELLERLCFEDELDGWDGIGFVVQTYQKRCPAVVDFTVDLARRSGHRLMVRLVKGAYWDSEIKRAQIDGLEGYPVYTRKAYTDVAYIACAKALLAAPDAVYPQFATHNAQTLATIHHLAGPDAFAPGQYEFQCLHGMGEPLYEQVVGSVVDGKLGRPCRIYAPVGTHETLLAYLVRRLLENGANTSFVNRIADEDVDLERLLEDPVATVEGFAKVEGAIGLPHPAIPLPDDLYGASRRNSRGLDLARDDVLAGLDAALGDGVNEHWLAEPLLADSRAAGMTVHQPESDVIPAKAGIQRRPAGMHALPERQPVRNPAATVDVVGEVREASDAQVDAALQAATAFAPSWAATPPSARVEPLLRAADALEADLPRLLALIVREAGKTRANAVSELREAVDFLRFYAGEVRDGFDNATHRPLGPVVCISPWNFPLAIFAGQIAAALAAGNPVLAKPAEQTPLIAAEMVRVLHRAGMPSAALQLLPGRGETIGARLVADPRTMGVLFTGSTAVARILQRALSGRLDAEGRPLPLIAETGGQNAMIVDSSALLEQAVADAINSAFDSAGQRCSALRVLCVQEDVADRMLALLEGAMAELRVGDPRRLEIDVGPVIDGEAKRNIEHHVAAMRANGRRVVQAAHRSSVTADGTFVLPTLIELADFSDLESEVFGPVLHVVRYARQDLDGLVAQINGTGYGLTLGLHTRIDETIARVVARARAGNVYVNRNMVGAVVGVQPFGGEGLSGTGPKAGGPLYLYRLLSERPDDVLARVLASAGSGDAAAKPAPSPALLALQDWAMRAGRNAVAAACAQFAGFACSGAARELRGPTGERNVYSLVPRDAVLGLAAEDGDRLTQLAATLAVGALAVWPAEHERLRAMLPMPVQERIVLARDWTAAAVAIDAIVQHGDAPAVRDTLLRAAARPGPILSVQRVASGGAAIALERLVVERSLSINTAAAGGNASLMTIG